MNRCIVIAVLLVLPAVIALAAPDASRFNTTIITAAATRDDPCAAFTN